MEGHERVWMQIEKKTKGKETDAARKEDEPNAELVETERKWTQTSAVFYFHHVQPGIV